MSVTNALCEPTASRKLKELAGKPQETLLGGIIPGQDCLFKNFSFSVLLHLPSLKLQEVLTYCICHIFYTKLCLVGLVPELWSEVFLLNVFFD